MLRPHRLEAFTASLANLPSDDAQNARFALRHDAVLELRQARAGFPGHLTEAMELVLLRRESR